MTPPLSLEAYKHHIRHMVQDLCYEQKTLTHVSSIDIMNKALDLLGRPEKKLPPAIYITGTNGKGSCCAFLFSLCRALHITYHGFTSPHLQDISERFMFNGHPISHEVLYHHMVFFQKFSQKHNIPLTFFQTMTLVAILSFSQNPVDLLIWEAGIGARKDATNVLTHFHSSVITSISLDHLGILGSTLEDIAYEKSGVMKPNTPCICAPQKPEVHKVLKEQGDSIATLFMDININDRSYMFHNLSLRGDHQKINAHCALGALFPQGYPRALEPFIYEGLQRATWPGRLTPIDKNSVLGRDIAPGILWLDGAHNSGGFSALRDFLLCHEHSHDHNSENCSALRDFLLCHEHSRDLESLQQFSQYCPYNQDVNRRNIRNPENSKNHRDLFHKTRNSEAHQYQSNTSWILIAGVLQRGKPKDLLDILGPIVEEIWTVKNFSSEPCFQNWQELSYSPKIIKNFSTSQDVLHYLQHKHHKQETHEGQKNISYIVTGSLHFVGDFLYAMEKREKNIL